MIKYESRVLPPMHCGKTINKRFERKTINTQVDHKASQQLFFSGSIKINLQVPLSGPGLK